MSPETGAGEWRDQLIAAGLLIPSGLDGLYGRSGVFESVVEAITDALSTLGADQNATVIRFPPVMPRATLELAGSLRSFPDQTGSIHTFVGGDREHAALLHSLDTGQDWTRALVPAETTLCSAVCHPLYPTLSSPLPVGGARWSLYGYVFRHERDVDPARLQCFRQYEYVYVGEPDGALAHRDLWVEKARAFLSSLGLDVAVEVTNDPFFGRLGRMLAANQQEDKLKYDVVAATASDTPAALASANYHRDHFGTAFKLTTSDGAVAHSTCVGFGVERITLALLWAHGLDPDSWPASIRRQLEG